MTATTPVFQGPACPAGMMPLLKFSGLRQGQRGVSSQEILKNPFLLLTSPVGRQTEGRNQRKGATRGIAPEQMEIWEEKLERDQVRSSEAPHTPVFDWSNVAPLPDCNLFGETRT